MEGKVHFMISTLPLPIPMGLVPLNQSSGKNHYNNCLKILILAGRIPTDENLEEKGFFKEGKVIYSDCPLK